MKDNLEELLGAIFESVEESGIDAPKKETKPKKPKKLWMPKDIKTHLDKSVVSQDLAKKLLSVGVCNHERMLRFNQSRQEDDPIIEKANILMVGTTGSGKSFLLKEIAKILDKPIVIVSASGLTKTGYVGEDATSIVNRLYEVAGRDKERAEQGIIFIDEFDKISAQKNSNGYQGQDIGGRDVQYELLKIIEGTQVPIKSSFDMLTPMGIQPAEMIDTTNILFICGGAFTGIEKKIESRIRGTNDMISFKQSTNLVEEKEIYSYNNVIEHISTDDFKEFGIIPELLGRLPIICPLRNLTIEDLKDILTKPQHATMKQIEKLASMYNVKLEYEDESIELIAKIAYNRGTGARGLRSIVSSIFDRKVFDINGRTKVVKITKQDILELYAKQLEEKDNETTII